MAVVNRVMVGESLVNDNDPSGTMAEIAHIDLLMGPRGSAVETAFCNGLVNNKDGFSTLLAVVAPNLPCKPNTMMFNKVTIKGATQAVQMFGPAQAAVAKAVADSVEDGTIPADEADDMFICVGVFIHWEAKSDEANVFYCGHSGWLVSTENSYIIFDYWSRNKFSENPGLANGTINPEELKDKKVYVIVSHDHTDHYDTIIYSWQKLLVILSKK